MSIDLTLSVDVASCLNPGQARKVLAEIFNHNPNLISFTKHAREQMSERDLKSGDVLNVLKAKPCSRSYGLARLRGIYE